MPMFLRRMLILYLIIGDNVLDKDRDMDEFLYISKLIYISILIHSIGYVIWILEHLLKFNLVRP